MSRYRTIVADPPWPQRMVGHFAQDLRNGAWKRKPQPGLPYPTMTLGEINALPVADLAEPDCHLWLWTTNAHLEDSFAVMRAWGFRYMTTITWVKPSGLGAYFASTTQHCLFGYNLKCIFPGRRWAPTHFHANPVAHSAKPEAFMDLVEEISPEPRIELFSRRARLGWDTWGNESLHGGEAA